MNQLPGIDFGADSSRNDLQDLETEQNKELVAGNLDLLVNVARFKMDRVEKAAIQKSRR